VIAGVCAGLAGGLGCHRGWIVWFWLDSTLDLSSTDSTQEYVMDAEHQPTDLAVGSNPLRPRSQGARRNQAEGVMGDPSRRIVGA
jgi:hypothetical protein